MFNRILFGFIVIFAMCFIFIKGSILSGRERTGSFAPPRNTSENGQRNISIASDQVRGHKHKKILKHIYPFLVVALLAKLVVVPLVLKFLVSATSSAFVMSKIALVTSAIVAMGWMVGASKEKPKLQIVQYPVGGSKLQYGGWNVKEKHAPDYATSFGDWNYDDNRGETYEKQVFL